MSRVDPTRASELLVWLDDDLPVYVHSASPKTKPREAAKADAPLAPLAQKASPPAPNNSNVISSVLLEESDSRNRILTDALAESGQLWLAALNDRQKHYTKIKIVLNNRSLIAADLVKEMHEAQVQQRAELAQAMQVFQMLGASSQKPGTSKKR